MRWTRKALIAAALMLAAPASAAEKISAEDGAAILALSALNEGEPAWLDVYLGEPFGLDDCDYGPIYDDDALDLETDNPQFRIVVAPSDPSRHPLNLASCEHSLQDERRGALRLRGCYMAHWIRIPRARQLALHPIDFDFCEGAKGGRR